MIVYLKSPRNELDTGMINIMNVLIKICDINHEKFWSDFDGRNIEKKIEDLFVMISPTFQKQRLFVKVQPYNITAIELTQRIDFIGRFNLVFYQANGNIITLSAVQSTKHAELRLIRHVRNDINEALNQKIVFNSSALPVFIFENFVSIAQNEHIVSNRIQIFQRIYFSGSIENNEQKKAALIDICYVLEKNKEETSDKAMSIIISNLKEILNIILSTVNLNNKAVRNNFAIFLFHLDDLDENEIVKNWLTSFTFLDFKLHSLWEEKILNLRSEWLPIDFAKIPEIQLDFLFETLKKSATLKKIKISGILHENCWPVSLKLKELKNLECLDLSYNYIGSEESKCFAEALKNLNNLSSLNLSQNYLNAKDLKLITNIFPYLPKLKKLNLSFNKLENEGAKVLAESLTNLSNLNSLDICQTFIKTAGAKSISKALSKMTNLIDFDISYNYIGESGAKHILKAFKRQNKIKTLNITNNRINTRGANRILKSLQKMNSLSSFKI